MEGFTYMLSMYTEETDRGDRSRRQIEETDRGDRSRRQIEETVIVYHDPVEDTLTAYNSTTVLLLHS